MNLTRALAATVSGAVALAVGVLAVYSPAIVADRGDVPAAVPVPTMTAAPDAAADPSATTGAATTAPTLAGRATTTRTAPPATRAPATAGPTLARRPPGTTTKSPPRTTTAVPPPAGGPVAVALATLRTAAPLPLTGYTRTAFLRSWTDPDRNGCDSRADAIARAAVANIIRTPGLAHCVLSALITDPYSGNRIPSTIADVDHVVALGDAWASGAATWTAARRLEFGNDPLNLLAVSAALNRSKGDQAADRWLPPSALEQCPYIARQVAVKARYGLTVTTSERARMMATLTTCPTQTLPTGPGNR